MSAAKLLADSYRRARSFSRAFITFQASSLRSVRFNFLGSLPRCWETVESAAACSVLMRALGRCGNASWANSTRLMPRDTLRFPCRLAEVMCAPADNVRTDEILDAINDARLEHHVVGAAVARVGIDQRIAVAPGFQRVREQFVKDAAIS